MPKVTDSVLTALAQRAKACLAAEDTESGWYDDESAKDQLGARHPHTIADALLFAKCDPTTILSMVNEIQEARAMLTQLLSVRP